jgi:hypothetical protein
MKPGSIGDPDFYLGAKLRMKRLSNSVLAWSMSSSKYIQAVGKEMPISRIVIVVPNTTVVLLD